MADVLFHQPLDLVSHQKVGRIPDKKNEEEVTCVGDIVGQWGTYQTRAAIIYMLVYIIAPFQNLGIIYYTDEPKDYWCKKPPGFEVSLTSWYHSVTFGLQSAENQTCNRYDEPSTKCTEWEYDRSTITLITEVIV